LLDFAIDHDFNYPYRPWPLMGVAGAREAAE
jgi:hypothetical protein